MKIASESRVLAEGAVVVALAFVLGQIKIYRLPYGGSVTAGSMVPLLWFALRHGLRSGIEIGAVYGMVDLALGDTLFIQFKFCLIIR